MLELKRRGSTRVILRYTLFQIPALVVFVLVLLVIRRWIQLPSWLIWLLILLWMVKDAVLYPFVWRAYDDESHRLHVLIGGRGTARERLSPTGYVWINGALWRAEVSADDPSVEKGQDVEVIDVVGLTLYVRPVKGKD